jgi:hypothetical protein
MLSPIVDLFPMNTHYHELAMGKQIFLVCVKTMGYVWGRKVALRQIAQRFTFIINSL